MEARKVWRKAKRWARYPFEMAGILFAVGFFSLLPRTWAWRVGRQLGAWSYAFGTRAKRVAHENLELVLGVSPEEARDHARESMKNFGAAMADLLRAPRMSEALAVKYVEIPKDTLDKVKELRESGRGAVIAGSHFGNWEFGNLAGAYTRLPPKTVVMRPVANPLVNRVLFKLRGWTGTQLITRAGAGMEAVQLVRDGGIMVIPFDVPVPPDVGAAAVDFFGLPTFTTVAVGYVAALARAPVYLVYFEPLGIGRYRSVMRGPLEAPIGETLRETAIETTERVSRALEEAIREQPQNWAWWLKRWKIRPAGATAGWPSYSVDETAYSSGARRAKRDKSKRIGFGTS